MGVLINKKRCDNADVCPCITECPTNAFYWNTDENSVAVDNNLCINCRQCVIACEAGAVKVARTDEEYQQIKTEYDEDIMTTEELFQDRYGAAIVDEKYDLDLINLEQLTKDSSKPLLIEFYNIDESRCLINSIPINDIIQAINLPISYRKINVLDIDLLKIYNIDTLPSLLVISNKEIIYKYIGFLDDIEKSKLLDDMRKELKIDE